MNCSFNSNRHLEEITALAPHAAIRTHYATLQLPPTATIPEIRSAYLRLILLHHPDRVRSLHNADGTRSTAMGYAEALNAAYEVLNDSAKKTQYDEELSKTRGGHAGSLDRPQLTFSRSACAQ